MSHAPKVSIVLPARNAAGTLPAALDSIRAQTFAGWEIVAVDDGSTDATPCILNAAANADARIRVLSLRPGGITAALQTGCDAARGGFIWLRWMDAGVAFGKVDAELLVWNDPPARLSRTEARYRTEAFYATKCLYLARWLKRHVAAGRGLWLWGAGRVTRQRFRALETAGIYFTGFIDIDAKKFGSMRDGRRVIGPDELPDASRAFILAGVAKRGARELISAELDRRGRSEGKDYLLVA